MDRLGPLVEDFVFLGGCAVGLLLTDPAAPPVRATVDVDVITEVGSLKDYYVLSGRLRELGFEEDQSDGAPICRWSAPPVVLDVMPTRSEILGFGNAWYKPALDEAAFVRLPCGANVRLITAPYFLATKLSAFESRGEGDYAMSYDLEDVIAVIDGRPEIVDEIANADDALRRFVTDVFRGSLDDPRFVDVLPGFLPGDSASQARLPMILERIRTITALA